MQNNCFLLFLDFNTLTNQKDLRFVVLDNLVYYSKFRFLVRFCKSGCFKIKTLTK